MPCTGLLVRPAIPLQEELREQKDVTGARAQRRDRNRDDVDAIEQILAEPLLLDLGLEIAVRRGDDARFERNFLVAADGADLALLEDAQQLDLHLDRISPISSRKMVPAPACTNRPARERFASVKAPRTWPNSSLSRSGAGIAAQLTATNGWSRRGEEVMERLGNELLARSRLAGHEHRGIAIGDAADHLDRLADRGARACDAVDRHIAVGGGAEALDLALEREVLECATDGDREGVDLHRLGDEVVRAGADGGDGGLEAALSREDDREEVGIALAQLLAEVDAGHTRHLNVGDDDVGRVGPEVLEALLGGVDGIDVEAALPQRVAQEDRSGRHRRRRSGWFRSRRGHTFLPPNQSRHLRYWTSGWEGSLPEVCRILGSAPKTQFQPPIRSLLCAGAHRAPTARPGARKRHWGAQVDPDLGCIAFLRAGAELRELALEPFELDIGQILRIDQAVASGADRSDQLVELEVQRLRVAGSACSGS